jgi:hypothetical protein
VLRALAVAVAAESIRDVGRSMRLDGLEQLKVEHVEAAPAVAQLLHGERHCVMIPPGATQPGVDASDAPRPRLLFPGAFNPPHEGHAEMATIAERRLGASLAWELSVANVDKPPLDFISIRDRLVALAAVQPPRPVAVTNAASFREKAALFPDATFVVGADTAARLAEPRYYGSIERRDDAIREIAAYGCRFLVFGRNIDGGFQSLERLDLPPGLRDICLGVPAAEFREDISSTQLRSGDGV